MLKPLAIFSNGPSHLPNKQRGLTMLEMIIATALSVTLLGGVYQIYSGNKRTYTLQDELARLQENARFSMEFLSRDIRNAGYTGCMRGNTAAQNNVAVTLASFDPQTGLQGWEATGTEPQATAVTIDPVGDSKLTTIGGGGWASTSSAPLKSINTVLPNSDIIRVWFSKKQAQPVTSIVGNSITLAAGLDNLEAGDVVVVSDCGRVDYIRQCGVNSSVIEAKLDGCVTAMAGKFLTVAAETAMARSLDMAVYFVGKPSSGDNNSPAGLYKRSMSGNTAGASQLISEGIENMQILYGEDTIASDNVVDQYVTADNVTDWNAVITVKISLLLSTANNVASQTYQGSYELNGVTLEPTRDRRVRRVFTTTIALRNRV